MLDAFFFDIARETPDAPALWVDGHTSTYAELAGNANAVGDVLLRFRSSESAESGNIPCLLFAHRSAHAYAGLLGILKAGQAYVPLGAKFPAERNAAIVRGSGATTMLVDDVCVPLLADLLPLTDPNIRIVLLRDILSARNVAHGASQTVPPQFEPARSEDDLAYVLFTSGTTGVPKGVKVRHANGTSYVRTQLKLNPVIPNARCSQFADITFDISVHDLFVTWAMGACLYVPDSADALTLATFVKTHQLTHWYSVPSTAAFLLQFRKLKPASFPSLRVTMFCGEALPTALARAWALAAPNSVLLNLYGPTECTVSTMRYDVTPQFLANFSGGVVPLGWPVPGEETLLINAAGELVEEGEQGELLLGGDQVAAGYVSDNPKDHAKFFNRTYPSRTAMRWYRTGDIASVSGPYGMLFHGRMDNQVKIRGNRIETQDVEHAVQQASDASMVAVIPWPLDENRMPQGLVAFVNNSDKDDRTILAQCRETLPVYAIPDRMIRLDTFPVNGNGKVDRNVLFGLCEKATAYAKTAASAA